LSTPLELQVCEGCGRAFFPARTLCPGCGGTGFHLEPARAGVVEEVTARTGADGTAVEIASVRLAGGPVVIARLTAQVAAGIEVVVEDEGGAPVARPPSA
jgi:uncharacterized OB-fold protein